MTMRPIFRSPPQLPAHAMKTYSIVSPISTHYRPATCAEVGCSGYTRGWLTVLDESTQQGQGQAYYIRRQSGRRFAEDRGSSGLTVFRFPPNGAMTVVDESTQQGQAQAHHIRKQSGREYTESRGTVFTFEPGQRCFRSGDHRLSLERPALYYVTGGDWRGNPRGTQLRHRDGDDWVSDFSEHQQRLADRLQQG